MDIIAIKTTAVALEILLQKYAQSDSEAAGLFEALKQLIMRAKNGNVSAPMEWSDIPGSYFFTEGTLRKYRDLEKAFAEFRIELTGGDNPVLG